MSGAPFICLHDRSGSPVTIAVNDIVAVVDDPDGGVVHVSDRAFAVAESAGTVQRQLHAAVLSVEADQ